jgi:hypothetical protein
MDENRLAVLLGQEALKVWADLPRDAQERLFAAAVDDGIIATELARIPARPSSEDGASAEADPPSVNFKKRSLRCR